MDTSTASHYSEIEIQDLLENLKDADIARLLQIYRTLGCDARSGLSAQDVLGQVIVKALSLERKWPRDLNVVSFFVETGKSIISNEEDKHSKLTISASIDELTAVDDETLKPTSATAKFSHEPTEVGIENSQSEDIIATWIEKIQQLFKGDAQADCFIKQKIQAHKKSKILDLCNFTDHIYRNVEKRIKDKVRKRFPNGLPWWEV